MAGDSSIRVIGRALEILRVINLRDSPSLAEIARTVDLPYPTVLRIVRALVEEGFVEREPSRKRYRPTAQVQALSCGYQSHDALVACARPHMEALTAIVHWPIGLATRSGDMMIVRDSTSDQTPLTFDDYYPGWQFPLLASASGRVCLAHMDGKALDALIRHVEATASHDEACMLRLFHDSGEAREIRKNGFAAISRLAHSSNPGRASSFAVPIFDGEDLLGTLFLVFFAAAMTMDVALATYLEPVLECARRIGKEMQRADNPNGIPTVPSF